MTRNIVSGTCSVPGSGLSAFRPDLFYLHNDYMCWLFLPLYFIWGNEGSENLNALTRVTTPKLCYQDMCPGLSEPELTLTYLPYNWYWIFSEADEGIGTEQNGFPSTASASGLTRSDRQCGHIFTEGETWRSSRVSVRRTQDTFLNIGSSACASQMGFKSQILGLHSA